jgi:DNA-binding NarL/FixJ family response regulator
VLVTTDRRPSNASLRAAGARAYVCKSWDERRLISAVRAGGVKLFPCPGSVRLSPREQDVLRLVATGLTTAGIGAKLGISAETVKHHSARLRQKLGARNRASAVALADAAGLLG